MDFVKKWQISPLVGVNIAEDAPSEGAAALPGELARPSDESEAGFRHVLRSGPKVDPGLTTGAVHR